MGSDPLHSPSAAHTLSAGPLRSYPAIHSVVTTLPKVSFATTVCPFRGMGGGPHLITAQIHVGSRSQLYYVACLQDPGYPVEPSHAKHFTLVNSSVTLTAVLVIA